jgi:ABC-type uncharacterized transport system substrate-binding protein
VTGLQVRGLEDFEPSFASMRAWQADAIFVLDDATFIASRAAMAAAAARHRLPLICGARQMAEAGCLFSYSASTRNHWSAKRALSRFWWISDLVQANGLACSL